MLYFVLLLRVCSNALSIWLRHADRQAHRPSVGLSSGAGDELPALALLLGLARSTRRSVLCTGARIAPWAGSRSGEKLARAAWTGSQLSADAVPGRISPTGQATASRGGQARASRTDQARASRASPTRVSPAEPLQRTKPDDDLAKRASQRLSSQWSQSLSSQPSQSLAHAPSRSLSSRPSQTLSRRPTQPAMLSRTVCTRPSLRLYLAKPETIERAKSEPPAMPEPTQS